MKRGEFERSNAVFKISGIVISTSTARDSTICSYTSTSCRRDWPSGLGVLNYIYSFHSGIFTCFSVGSSHLLLLIYFRDGPNRCLHCTKMWNKTHSICDAPLK